MHAGGRRFDSDRLHQFARWGVAPRNAPVERFEGKLRSGFAAEASRESEFWDRVSDLTSVI